MGDLVGIDSKQLGGGLLKTEKAFRLGLSEAPGIGPQRWQQLLQVFGSAEAVFQATKTKLLAAGLSERITDLFLTYRSGFKPEARWGQIIKAGISPLILGAEEYPRRLSQIKAPPPVVYCLGEMPGLARSVAIVGTRKPTAYGRYVTKLLVDRLLSQDVVVVSGLAFGIDDCAHQTTVDKDGKTVAVLGSGVLQVAPAAHSRLAKSIATTGAVVSTFIPEEGAKPGFFAARNRIIAGLSQAVVVVEGGEKSGALITAREAMKQGKPVFAVPGPITSSMSQAPYQLFGEGAVLLTDLDMVFRALEIAVLKKNEASDLAPEHLTPLQADIWGTLGGGEMEVDELAVKCKAGISTLNQALLEMELTGLIQKWGKWVSRVS